MAKGYVPTDRESIRLFPPCVARLQKRPAPAARPTDNMQTREILLYTLISPDLLRIAAGVMAVYETFYVRIMSALPIRKLTSHLGIERTVFTTACPVDTKSLLGKLAQNVLLFWSQTLEPLITIILLDIVRRKNRIESAP